MSQESELERVERHILQCQGHVDRQKSIVERKRRYGQPIALSEQILDSLQTSLSLHRQNRDQLWRMQLRLV